MIPYGRQSLSQADLDAVQQVLAGDWLTQGPFVPAFEHALAQQVQAPYAVAMANGTAALHATCAALGISANDRVWTSPISFVASANCARYLGAQVDFVDINPTTRTICPLALRQKLDAAKAQRQLPKLLVAVHFAGAPCDMPALAALAQEYGFLILEDAAHAIGSYQDGKPIGHCQYSVATCFSFHPVKTITTGEGGAVTTQDEALANKIRKFCSHGITKNPDEFVGQQREPWVYQQHSLGVNYRLTDIQAALGISQLQQLPHFVARRQALFNSYQQALAQLPVFLPVPQAHTAWHLYAVQLHQPEKRLAVFNALRQANIGVNVHYMPIHLQPYYQRRGCRNGDYPAAEAYYAGALSLPLFPALTDDQQAYCINTFKEALCA